MSLSLCQRGRRAAGARQLGPAAVAHASARPSLALGHWPAPGPGPGGVRACQEGAARRRRCPRGSCQHQGCSAHVPEPGVVSRAAELHSHQPRSAREVTARLTGHRRLTTLLPWHSSELAWRGTEGGSWAGAVLTSWAVLLHAAFPGLQQRRAGDALLPGGLWHLPDPRLHTPLAATGPSLVGAGAPRAPRPRLAGLWLGGDDKGVQDGGGGLTALGTAPGGAGTGCGCCSPWHSRVPGCAAVLGGHCRKHCPLCR